MRDDDLHEDAHDGPSDLRVTVGALTPPWSHRRADPRANEWTWGDIVMGWLLAHIVLAAVGFTTGAMLATVDPLATGSLFAIGATVWGTLVVSLFGVPWGGVLATRLQPIRSELLHLAAFAVLGAVGSLIHSAIVFPGYHEQSLLSIEFLQWFALMSLHGVTAAVGARFLAKRWAVLMRGMPRSRSVSDAGAGDA